MVDYLHFHVLLAWRHIKLAIIPKQSDLLTQSQYTEPHIVDWVTGCEYPSVCVVMCALECHQIDGQMNLAKARKPWIFTIYSSWIRCAIFTEAARHWQWAQEWMVLSVSERVQKPKNTFPSATRCHRNNDEIYIPLNGTMRITTHEKWIARSPRAAVECRENPLKQKPKSQNKFRKICITMALVRHFVHFFA